MTNRNIKKIIRISSENKNNKTVQKTVVFLEQKGSDRESKKKRRMKLIKGRKKIYIRTSNNEKYFQKILHLN